MTYFLVNHITRSTYRLRSRYQTLAAQEDDSERLESSIKRIELFEASLPNASSRRLLAGLVAVAALVALPIARLLFKEAKAGDAMGNLATAVSDTNPWNFGQALLSKGGLFACAILALTLYLLVILPLTAFRWQRMMFVLYPSSVEPVDNLYVTDFNQPAGGVYDLQRELFTSLGITPVKETPWEMWGRVAALAALPPLWMLLRDPAQTVDLPFDAPGDLSLGLAVLFGAGLAGGALLLNQAWRKRNHEKPRVSVQRSAYATAVPHKRDRMTARDIASLWSRAGALAVDVVFVGTLAAVGAAAMGALFGASDDGLLMFLLLPPAALLYSAPTMLRRGAYQGQTFGKQFSRIRVVMANGEPVRMVTVLLRECLLKWTVILGVVCIYSLFLPLAVTIVWAVLSKQNRPPHDLLARTVAGALRSPRQGGQRLHTSGGEPRIKDELRVLATLRAHRAPRRARRASARAACPRPRRARPCSTRSAPSPRLHSCSVSRSSASPESSRAMIVSSRPTATS